MEKIYIHDQAGKRHNVCNGNSQTGEIIFEPTKRAMCRMFLMKNQPLTIRKTCAMKDWLIIIRWNGESFTTTYKVA